MEAKPTGILCVYDSRGAGKQTEEFCCHAVECGGGDFSKHDPVWVIEVLEAEVWGQAKHITSFFQCIGRNEAPVTFWSFISIKEAAAIHTTLHD